MKEMHRNSEIIVDNGKVAVLSCFLVVAINLLVFIICSLSNES